MPKRDAIKHTFATMMQHSLMPNSGVDLGAVYFRECLRLPLTGMQVIMLEVSVE
jgi:hypothetical protein